MTVTCKCRVAGKGECGVGREHGLAFWMNEWAGGAYVLGLDAMFLLSGPHLLLAISTAEVLVKWIKRPVATDARK